MNVIFLKVLQMSIASVWLITGVLVVRFCLDRAPRWIACLLWAMVAMRLVCPFTMESGWSRLPESVADGAVLERWTDGYAGDTALPQDNSSEPDNAV